MAWTCLSVRGSVMTVVLIFGALLCPLATTAHEVLEQCNYTIVTSTGRDAGAATDSSISVRLENRDGNNATFPLQNGLDDFERGQVDVFFVHGNCVENICKVVLYTNDKGFFPRWYVDTIKVNGKTFPMHSWLPRDDGLNNLFIVRNECHYAYIPQTNSIMPMRQ